MESMKKEYEFKLKSDWIEIEHVPDEHEEKNNFKPSFWYWNRRYFLEDFVRVHNNPWIRCSEFPDYIHGMESDQYVNPLFIEISEAGDAVRVYEEVKKENTNEN